MTTYKNKIVKELLAEKFTIEQIKNALCDGNYLSDLMVEGYSQDDIEDAYNEINC